MPSWYEEEYGVCAGRWQHAVDVQAREDLRLGWQHPDGMRKPAELVCRVCWYVVVDGCCVNGCTSLSERGKSEAARAVGPSPRSERDAA